MHRSQNKKFDQQVKNTFDDASVEPPAFLWNAIESKLPPSKTWYSKYKYLLLLLLLTFTSASSIFIYKNLVLKNNISPVALNKRMLKDETGANGQTANGNLNVTTAENENASKVVTDNNATTTTSKNAINNSNQKPTVASFYRTDKNGNASGTVPVASNQQTETTKRAARLKRLEVKKDSQESGVRSQDVNGNNFSIPISLTVSKNKKSAKKTFKNTSQKNDELKNNNSSDKNNTLAKNENGKNINADNSTNNPEISEVTADNSSNNNSNITNQSSNNTSTEDDVTKPIAEPIRGTAEEPLTASVVPVKVQQSPIPSRDVLRSMIAPEKLEKLDIGSQAAGINDLNPNKDKMLKNLKQFAGYDINKGFYIGAFISINNVWLNKKQFSADENTTSIKPKVQFGKAYGLNIGYDYTDRWGIVLEWQISEQGQKYSITQQSDNDKHTKDVNLMYTKFPLMLKYKQTFINNYNSKPIALSFLFGPQFAGMIKQNVQLDGKTVSNAPQYNKAEFGIMGGFDFDLFMTRNIALTIGGRTGFGTSMRKGDPMSFQLGITTQLNFRFPKKIK